MKPETRKMLEEAERDADAPTTLPPLDESGAYSCAECKGGYRCRGCILDDEEKEILNKLKQSSDNIPPYEVTRLVDRKEPWSAPSFHSQMEKLKRRRKYRL